MIIEKIKLTDKELKCNLHAHAYRPAFMIFVFSCLKALIKIVSEIVRRSLFAAIMLLPWLLHVMHRWANPSCDWDLNCDLNTSGDLI